MTASFSIDEDLAFAGKLADAAWSAIRPHFRALTAVDNKAPPQSAFDPVTVADQGAEEAMRALIAAERLAYGITGEEFPSKPTDNGLTWLLDPIDGTRAFVAGLPSWTTLIALCDRDGVPLIGVIDQPVLGERYLGWPGGAAMQKDGQTEMLNVSNCKDLRHAVISTTDPFILNPAEQGAWTHLRATARLARYGLDAYAYARLAAGTIDLVAESCLKAWDVAALIPVVRGAGGLATDWRGNTPKLGGQIVCCASEEILDQALLALRRSADTV